MKHPLMLEYMEHIYNIRGIPSDAQRPANTAVQDFITSSATTTSRIGTLFVGRAVVPAPRSNIFLKTIPPYECAHKGNPPYTESCLDVTSGGANFAHLLVNQISYWNGLTTVGSQGGLGGGGGSSVASTLTINSNGNNTGLLVSGLGFFNAQGGFAPRNLTTTVPVCAKADGTMVRCNEPEPMAYHWDVGNYGACNGQTYPKCNGNYPVTNGGACEGQWQSTGPGSCGGYPTNEVKIDWEGNPFDWAKDVPQGSTRVFKKDIPHPEPSHVSQCPYDNTMVRCNNVNSVETSNNPCNNTNVNCVAHANYHDSEGDFYCPHMSAGHWDRLQLISGITNEVMHTGLDLEGAVGQCNGTTQQSCQAKAGCTWTPGETQTNYCAPATNQADCLERNSACSWNTRASIVSCAGPTNANECTAQHPNCSFVPGNPGTKTRTVVCKNANNQTVADQFCINTVGPKPSTSGSCGISQGF
ncbi:MAG TPA: hypothetical protein VKX40_16645 [Aequorivita sp.]|nr:hypothetical protein [Aequorivita sp.]